MKHLGGGGHPPGLNLHVCILYIYYIRIDMYSNTLCIYIYLNINTYTQYICTHNRYILVLSSLTRSV